VGILFLAFFAAGVVSDFAESNVCLGHPGARLRRNAIEKNESESEASSSERRILQH
jgi:hypothetical protein